MPGPGPWAVVFSERPDTGPGFLVRYSTGRISRAGGRGKGGPARARGIRRQFFLTANRRIEMESREVS